MVEVEVKIPVKNKKQVEEKLLELGFLKGDLLKESDFYFDNACHELKEKDMALRIRSCENLTTSTTEHFITYKGPKMDKISMTRKELETKIESAETGREILKSLGYTEVPPVIKRRQELHKDQMNACLDQVEHLGDFLELEIVVQQESEKENALNELISLLYELGYQAEDIIRTSYLSMLQNKESK
ncbi:MAG: class IV adenylate cyclase [Lachnospiraceae bacterium]|nr:class IV adenylate cyclase [Lachnospiraceae bacterium]